MYMQIGLIYKWRSTTNCHPTKSLYTIAFMATYKKYCLSFSFVNFVPASWFPLATQRVQTLYVLLLSEYLELLQDIQSYLSVYRHENQCAITRPFNSFRTKLNIVFLFLNSHQRMRNVLR